MAGDPHAISAAAVGLRDCFEFGRARSRHVGDIRPMPQSGAEVDMGERFVTRGFVGRRDDTGAGLGGEMGGEERRRRTPPGQYLTTDFPVLSAGPTPRTPLDRWSFRIEGLVREPIEWSW